MARIVDRNGKYKVIIELGRDPKTGKRIRHTKEGFKTKKEAKTYATIKENELLSGTFSMSNKILLENFISEWYDRQIKDSYATNTVTGYNTRIKQHIIPYMGKIQLNKIKTTDVQEFYYNLIDNGLKPISAKRVILSLKKCLAYAQKLGLISNNPCDIEYIKDSKGDKLKVWTEEQLIYFLDEIKEDYLYTPIMLAAFTGMRIGELCGLQWSNIDFDNNKILIAKEVINDKLSKKIYLTEILKTSTSLRFITIPNFLKEYLSSLCPDDKDSFVILSRNDELCNPRNLSMNFTKKVSKFKDLPQISFHDLRHTHATILLKHGENIKVISERLGHSSIKTTLDTYSHVLPSMEEHTALLLDNIFINKLDLNPKGTI